MTPEQREIVKGLVAKLHEHFDSVQVFVTFHGSAEGVYGTHSMEWGHGNYFARLGQVQTWVKQETACAEAQAIEKNVGDDE